MFATAATLPAAAARPRRRCLRGTHVRGRSTARDRSEAGNLQPGSRVGAYRVVAPLGGGGMGLVYLAEHVALGRRVAVKVLRPELAARPGAAQRFVTEARAAASIRHPGVVEIFDFGTTADHQTFLVMEWLTGTTLADHVRTTPTPLPVALVLARRIARALAAAHARGVVHRDLKPDNVFLIADPDGGAIPQIKLLDFGIARLVDDASPRQTRTGVVLGTPVYMSPEQCRTAPCDHRADLYALGCLLVELVAGRPPFVTPSTGELIAAHLLQPAPALDALVPGAPPALVALVARLLAKAPDARPRDAATVAAELERLIAATARIAAPAALARPWSRLATTMAIGATAAAVTATALLRQARAARSR